MALFASSRDASFLRHMNREVMGNVISQQCAFYKYKLVETKINMYGESSGGKFYDDPVLLYSLITVGDNTSPTSDLGVNFDWPVSFAFLRDDLVDANVHPEVGDIILDRERYYEVYNVNENHIDFGNDDQYIYGYPNFESSSLNKRGQSLVFEVDAVMTRPVKLNILPYKIQ